MHKAIGMAILAFLSCLPMPIVISESIQAQTTQDRKTEADWLFDQGLQLVQVSRYQEALQAWENSLQIYREIKNRQNEGAALGNIGNAYYSLGKYDKAIEFDLQKLVIVREIKDRQEEGTTLGNLGIIYSALGKYDKAIDYHLQSLAIAREIKDRSSEVTALENLGIDYQSLGRHDKSIDYYLQCLMISRDIKNRHVEVSALRGLGNAYYSLSKYDKAIDSHLQSLAIAKEIRDRREEGAVLGSLGLIYESLGKYNQAIDYHLQYLAITRELKDRRGQAAALENLGVVYDFLGRYDKLIDYSLESLAIAREIKDSIIEGASLGNLGNAYRSIGKYKQAIEYYLQRLAISRESKDLRGESSVLANLGSTYYFLGKYDQAIEYYQQSLAIIRKIKYRFGEGSVLGNLGIVYNAIGKYDKAIEYYLPCLAITREIKDREGERTVLANMGNIFPKLNQSEIAILFYKQSVNVTESIRRDILGLSKKDQQSYLITIEKSYRELVNLLLQKGRVMEALQVLDLLKVQELEDYFKNIKGSDRSAQGVRLLEPEKAMSGKLGAISFENSPEINSQLANQIQQLPKSEINKVPDYLQKIPQGTALLYPLILGDRLEIILFTPNTIPISRTVKISQKELETLVIDFKAALLDPNNEDAKETATTLYKLLIKPIEAELVQAKATTILYAPDGQLRYIPIAALYDGKQWLAEKYQISNLIAYSLFDFASNPKTQPNILAGAFGGKAGDKKFGQDGLPATLTEVQAIANSFQNSVTLIEENFSRQAIESKFKNHNLLHLATHAEFSKGTPDQSFIIFGNGDKIFLNEIADWQIPNIDLIVLSACQTGVGDLGDGVEILGFGYQVQKAGAKNAIASLWKVNDIGTQALMAAFYRELQKGDVTVTEALQRAQVSLIKSSEFNHPNYWSAFFAIGNGL